jgi:hypothetical protein
VIAKAQIGYLLDALGDGEIRSQFRELLAEEHTVVSDLGGPRGDQSWPQAGGHERVSDGAHPIATAPERESVCRIDNALALGMGGNLGRR